MQVNTRNRTELKSYFVKNAIPTESNFAELIDGMLNQADDGLVKLPGDPLSIEAAGDSASEKKAIHFYRNFAEPQLDWTLSLNPRRDPGDSDTAQLGFNIGDGEGYSRLFIDRNTGSIGIGTIEPEAKLHIVGRQDLVSLRVGHGSVGEDFTMDVAGGQGLVSFVAGAKIKPDGTGYTFLGARGASRITLHDGSLYFYTSDETQGTPDEEVAGLSVGGAKMILDNQGNVGIGPTNPKKRLHVDGDYYGKGHIWLHAFEGDGKNGTAYIQARDDSGESNLNLQFRTQQGGTTKDVITLTAGGNVCIGTTEPELTRRYFNGVDDYDTFPDQSRFQITHYTVELWMKPDGVPNEPWTGIIGKPGRNYNIWLHSTGLIHHRFHTSDSTNEGAPDTPAGSIKWDQWNHVAITNDGDMARTYINGELKAEGPVKNEMVVDKTFLYLGRSLDGADTNYFKGHIADVRIWDEARDEGQIQANMNRELDGTEAGLVFSRYGGANLSVQGSTHLGGALTVAGNVGIGTTRPASKLDVAGPILERLDVIQCGRRNDWTAANHPIMQYFKNKLKDKPVGTMVRAIPDLPGWRGHYWQGWVDGDNRVRVIHNYHNTTAVI